MCNTLTLPLPMSAWEPISAILHKIAKQCSCLLLQQRMHPTSVYSHTRMPACHLTHSLPTLCNAATHSAYPLYPGHSLLSAGNKYRPPSCAMSSGTWSLHRPLHNITFWEKLPLPDDTVPTTLSFTYSLNYTHFGQHIPMHTVTSTLHIHFLFHTPWNFT